MIRGSDRVEDDHPALKHPKEREHWPWQIFAEPALHVFTVAVVLFQLANAALLPLALNALTRRGEASGFLISATIIVPQVITASVAPWAGRLAQQIGRRPVLIVGFAAVPMRALLFATLPGALPLGRVSGFGRHQCGGIRADAAADSRRSDQANRLSQYRDRLVWVGVRPRGNLQHFPRRVDRGHLWHRGDVPVVGGGRRHRNWRCSVSRCRKPGQHPRDRSKRDAEKATLPA